jgi:hypothetical protein
LVALLSGSSFIPIWDSHRADDRLTAVIDVNVLDTHVLPTTMMKAARRMREVRSPWPVPRRPARHSANAIRADFIFDDDECMGT